MQNNQANRETTVVTPEHVQLRFQTAGIGSRAAAQLMDTGILLLVNITCVIVFSIVVFGSDTQAWGDVEDLAIAILLFALFLINTGYFFILEAFWSGQTLGKRWMKLRVIRENGQPITFLTAAIRNLFRIIDVLPSGYFVGALVCFFHPQDKRIGDLVAGTIVVAEGDPSIRLTRSQKALEKDGTGQLFMLDERQKRAITREDWQLLSAYVARLDSLSAEKKQELGRQIADRFVQKLELNERREEIEADAIVFLQRLYGELREDWQLGK